MDVLSLQATDFAVVGRYMLEDLPLSFFRSTKDKSDDGRTSNCYDSPTYALGVMNLGISHLLITEMGFMG
jgi:hypothetical protein